MVWFYLVLSGWGWGGAGWVEVTHLLLILMVKVNKATFGYEFSYGHAGFGIGYKIRATNGGVHGRNRVSRNTKIGNKNPLISTKDINDLIALVPIEIAILGWPGNNCKTNLSFG